MLYNITLWRRGKDWLALLDRGPGVGARHAGSKKESHQWSGIALLESQACSGCAAVAHLVQWLTERGLAALGFTGPAPGFVTMVP